MRKTAPTEGTLCEALYGTKLYGSKNEAAILVRFAGPHVECSNPLLNPMVSRWANRGSLERFWPLGMQFGFITTKTPYPSGAVAAVGTQVVWTNGIFA